MAKIDNVFIKSQITNQIMVTESFKQYCEMAALKNDGVVDKEEQKVLNKINKCTDSYLKELKKIVKEF